MSRAERYTHRPGSVLAAAAILFGMVVVGTAGTVSLSGLVASGVGLVGLVVGITRTNRRLTGFATIGLLGGVVAAGVVGAGPERLLPATAAAILSWNFAIGSLAENHELQGGTVERTEALHVVTATATGILATGLIYGVYRTLAVGYSVVGVGLLLLATVALGLAARK